MNKSNNFSLAILNALMTTDDYLSTSQLISRVRCDRKTIYKVISDLEINGFRIEVLEAFGRKKGGCNKYRYLGLYGGHND